MDQIVEQWRPVVGWEGLYEVSDQGRVRSLCDGWVDSNRWSYADQRSHFVSAVDKRQGISPLTIMCVLSGIKKKGYCSPILLPEAFVGPCPDGMECCHGPGWAFRESAGKFEVGDKAENNDEDKLRDGTTRLE